MNRRPELSERTELVFCGWLDGVTDFESQVVAAGQAFGNVRYIGPKYGQQKAATLNAAGIFVLPRSARVCR